MTTKHQQHWPELAWVGFSDFMYVMSKIRETNEWQRNKRVVTMAQVEAVNTELVTPQLGINLLVTLSDLEILAKPNIGPMLVAIYNDGIDYMMRSKEEIMDKRMAEGNR